MEKFTVDLDKVLDEFEFNEEQAFHKENFKNEDLPAKRYQKPHFQPINMADADFSPSYETTMSFPSHNRKNSQDSTNSSTTSDNVSLNCKYIDINNTVITDLIEAPAINNNSNNNNFHTITETVEQDEDKLEKIYNQLKTISPASSTSVGTSKTNTTIAETTTTVVEECSKKNQSYPDSMNAELNNSQSEGSKIPLYSSVTNEKDHIENQSEVNSINVDVIPEANFECLTSKIEESQIKPDLIGSECNPEEGRDDLAKLPDLTEMDKKCQDSGESKVENFDLISTDKEMVKSAEVEASVDVEKGEIDKTNDNCVQESDPPSSICEESEPMGQTITPIQFQPESDITDEDLHRYLEELEEEEERNSRENLQKPARPDSLNLNEGTEPNDYESPGATPLPRNVEKMEKSTGNLGSPDEDSVSEVAEKCEEVTIAPTQTDHHKINEELEEVEGAEAAPTTRPQMEPLTIYERRLGKVPPYWMPDSFASTCMECDSKFIVIRRRHHCRACGRILCSKCCGMRASLEYLQNQEQRVCSSCFLTLAKVMMYEPQYEAEQESSPTRKPNPNNPMEYCSTVPPPLQVSNSSSLSPPSVLVPVGVLKREGVAKAKENQKQVMFSDGIRPGGDLTDLDGSADQRRGFRRSGRSNKRVGTPPGNSLLSPVRMLPPIDIRNQSFIPEKGLPPVCVVSKGETTYQENWPHDKLMERLKNEEMPPLTFAVNRHLIVSLKMVKLKCCMKKTCWAFCTKGMESVGQDEIVILLTLKDDEDDVVPKDVFLQLHYIHQEAAKGNTINELGCWCVLGSTFLDSQQHGGFLFIRPTFQCLNRIETPSPPFLVGILIHKSEIPWARVFPIRLMLRLGAEFRYYPCPLVSVRFREPVYYDIGHTIIKLLADFRNLSYTLPNVPGLKIHMEAKQASILIPRNRYDEIVRALNNSNDPVLALAGNFSQEADAHLVCMQSKGEEITYKTQTININDKPRNVTGASFVVLNGALKTTSGLSAKISFVEDGLLVQVPNETMTVLRNKLRNMEDWSVKCGPVEGDDNEDKSFFVKIIWCEDDKNFNVGVKSVIDNMAMDGIPFIRTRNFADCLGSTKFIRWTQVYIIKCEDGATSAKIGDPLEINKLSESIARATFIALKKLLDLLAASGLTVLAVRATIDEENVGYEAGSNGEKLPPIYMNSLDNELIPVLHKAASVNDSVAVLELVFHIMEQ